MRNGRGYFGPRNYPGHSGCKRRLAGQRCSGKGFPTCVAAPRSSFAGRLGSSSSLAPSRGLVVPGVEVGEDAVGGLLAGLAGLLEEAHAGDGVGAGEVEAFRALESFYGRVEFRRLGPLLDDAGEDDVRGEGVLRGRVGVPRLEDVAVEGSLGVVAVEPARERGETCPTF